MTVDPRTLSIVHYPHPVLKQRCAPIEAISAEVRAVAEKMLILMAEAEGLGLAAPQVGLPWRMFVTSAREDHPATVFINPVFSNATGDAEVSEEGCLSLPGVHVDVRRPPQITITALDLDGNEFSRTSSDLSARVWQHETDHLDGILIIDKMGPMDRLANRRAIKELKAGANSTTNGGQP